MTRSVRIRRALALCLLAAAPTALAAQQPDDPLAPLVREGLERNLGLAASRLEAVRSRLEVPRADAALLPTLDVAARYSEFSGVVNIGDLINPAYAALNQLTGTNAFPTDISLTQPFKQDMRVQLVQPLFAPAAWAGRSVARAVRDEGAARVGTDARALAAGIRLAWLRAAGADRFVAIWQAARTVVDEGVRVNMRLVAAGLATPDALSRARADRADVVQSEADAVRDADAARRALNELVQRPLEAPLAPRPDTALALQRSTAAVRIADQLADDPLLAVAALPVLDAALRSALARREELAGADAAERRARGGVRLAGASLLPTVALAGDYGFQGNGLRFSGANDFAVASLSLQWNLFRGGADAVRRGQARLQQEQARLLHAALVQQIEREVRDAHQAARVADGLIVTADERLSAAARTLDLVARRYEEGLASHLEFTDARAAWTRAGLGAVLARVSRAARHVELHRVAALAAPLE